MVGFMKGQGCSPIQPKETAVGPQLTEAVNGHPNKKCGVIKGVDNRQQAGMANFPKRDL
jgi:hypothetical protein